MTYTVNYGKQMILLSLSVQSKRLWLHEREDKAEILEDIVSEEIKLYTESFLEKETDKKD